MKFAVITPSYRGDLDRCRLLCESTNRFLPDGIEHILIVERRDVPLFRPLESPKVRLVVGQSLMPWWIFRLPGVRRWWASLATPPIRNWIHQQLIKISSVHATDADVILFIDSDVTLVRPLDPGQLVKDGRVRLLRVPYTNDEYRAWIQGAGRILKIPDPDASARAYVGWFVTWRRDNVLRMIDHIQRNNGVSWIRTLCRHWRFSEYTLYGIFVEEVLGLEAAGHYADDNPDIHQAIGRRLQTPEDVAGFLAELRPDHHGIMIHSKDGIPVDRYRDQVRSLWEAASRTGR